MLGLLVLQSDQSKGHGDHLNFKPTPSLKVKAGHCSTELTLCVWNETHVNILMHDKHSLEACLNVTIWVEALATQRQPTLQWIPGHTHMQDISSYGVFQSC